MEELTPHNLLKRALCLIKQCNENECQDINICSPCQQINPFITSYRRRSVPKHVILGREDHHLIEQSVRRYSTSMHAENSAKLTTNNTPNLKTIHDAIKTMSNKCAKPHINSLKLFQPDFSKIRVKRHPMNKVTISLEKLLQTQMPINVGIPIKLSYAPSLRKSRQPRLYYNRATSDTKRFSKIDSKYSTSRDFYIQKGFNYDKLLPLSTKHRVEIGDTVTGW
jgi:hypothetical protein